MDYKTNVMRTLEQQKIPFVAHSYQATEALSGVEVAEALNINPMRVFKTLVTVGKSGNHFVFLLPAPEELDLKKAAAAVGEKSLEMLKSKDLLPLTGYLHGGCSPIGMKKHFPTIIHFSAEKWSEIVVSAGKIGYQIEINIVELKKIIQFKLADIIK